METALKAKLDQNDDIRVQLRATRPLQLVEASVHDRYWSAGVDLHHVTADSSKWTGENKLGLMLTKLRDGYIDG